VAHGNGAQVAVAGQDFLSGHRVISPKRRASSSRVVRGKAGLPRKAIVPNAPDPSKLRNCCFEPRLAVCFSSGVAGCADQGVDGGAR